MRPPEPGENTTRLAAFVASGADAVVSKTLDGVITSWNKGAELVFGFSPAEAIGQPIDIIIPPERMAEEAEILRRLSRGETVEHFETERLRKGGGRVKVSLRISPIRDATGRIIGASKIARDITDRTRREETLARTVQTLEALYNLVAHAGRAGSPAEIGDAALDAIQAAVLADRASVLVFDEQGIMRFLAWRGLSDEYRRAVEGHSPWSRETQNPEALCIEDAVNDERMGSARAAIANEGIHSICFIPLVSMDKLIGKFAIYYDSAHWFDDAEVRLATTIGRHVSFGLSRLEAQEAVKSLLDRERRARKEADAARAEAERTSKGKDEFLAMLAHELRNPLSAIVNAVAVLGASSSDEGSRSARALGMIERQTEHLARLIDDLLDVARIRSGLIEIEREPMDVRAAVSRAVDAHRHRIEAKRQRLAVSLPDSQIIVRGDVVRLQQVVGNLVNNASKYAGVEGSIDVNATLDGGSVVLSVRDDGPGVPPDKLDAIFELFVQANPTLGRSEGGLGIGLTLVKRVVDLHGGTVSAQNNASGGGAEFIVRLPAAGEAPANPLEYGVQGPVVPLRILVIDDQNDGREGLAAVLQTFGHEVMEAATGLAGLQAAARHSPDVVIVDIGLPDLDGYEVARRVRQAQGDSICLVALTGYGQPRDRARSEEAGFDAHLVKPIEPRKLVETLDRLTRSGAE
jgi:PAS domain S-box-containing protein